MYDGFTVSRAFTTLSSARRDLFTPLARPDSPPFLTRSDPKAKSHDPKAYRTTDRSDGVHDTRNDGPGRARRRFLPPQRRRGRSARTRRADACGSVGRAGAWGRLERAKSGPVCAFCIVVCGCLPGRRGTAWRWPAQEAGELKSRCRCGGRAQSRCRCGMGWVHLRSRLRLCAHDLDENDAVRTRRLAAALTTEPKTNLPLFRQHSDGCPPKDSQRVMGWPAITSAHASARS